MTNTANTSEIREEIQDAIESGEPMLITGSPGIGKSDIIAAVCNDMKQQLIISHPVVSDPTDYKGLPAMQNGQADFVPFGELRAMMEATQPTVVFFDDFGQAEPAVQKAMMQILLAREINGKKISDNVTFLAATNGRKDRAGVAGIMEPVKSRFTAGIIEMTVDNDAWCQWAAANGMPVELIAFIRFRPNLLNEFVPTNDLVNSPSPRTVAAVGRYVSRCFNRQAQPKFSRLSGIAGEAFAAEFTGFLEVWRSLPNPDGILLNPDAADMPTDPAVLFALCGALSRKANDQNIDNLFKYAGRMQAEFAAALVKDTVNGKPELQQTLAFNTWAASNHAVNF